MGRSVLYAEGARHGPSTATGGCRTARPRADHDSVTAGAPALRRLVSRGRVVGRGTAGRRSRRVRVAPLRRADARPFDERGGAAAAGDPDPVRPAARLAAGSVAAERGARAA